MFRYSIHGKNNASLKIGLGAERLNQEHKTHSAYHDPKVSRRIPERSWMVREGPGVSGRGSGGSWRVRARSLAENLNFAKRS